VTRLHIDWTARVLVALAITTSVVLFRATSASAHAELIGTSPAWGVQLAEAPARIELRFSEGVEIALGAIRVFDSDSRQVNVPAASHFGDDTVVAVELNPPSTDRLSPPPSPWASGQYAVAWRVVSDDGHPLSGAFLFTVGADGGGADPEFLATVLARDGRDATVRALVSISRVSTYAGLSILLGGLAFLLWCWPAGAARGPSGDERSASRRRVGAVLWTAGALALIASLAQIALQGAYATGRGLGAAFEPSLWRAVSETRTGRAWLVRSIAIAALMVAAATRSRLSHRSWQGATATASLVVLVSVAFGGHGANGRAPRLGTVTTVVHVAAAAIWIGGLAMLLVALLDHAANNDRGATDGNDNRAERSTVALRFSRLATWTVAGVAVTGVVQALRQVGSVDALTSTNYGKLLMLKVAIVALVIITAAVSRRLVRSSNATPAGSLRWTVGSELIGVAAVLVLTSLLVNTAPAVAARAKPFAATVFRGDRSVSITVEPGRVGLNDIHITLTSASGSFEAASAITAQLTLPARGFGPLEVPLQSAGPNHAIASGVSLTLAGNWRLEIAARYGEFTEVRFAVDVNVR
jgi:copper transport protein